MGWIFLAESEGSALPSNLGYKPSHTANESGMHKESCSPEWNRGSLTSLQFGTMSLLSEVRRSMSPSISSQPDSLVRISVLEGSVRVWQESEAVYFSKSQDLQKSFDLPSSSSKMSQLSEPVAQKQYAKHWPRSGMICAGLLSQPPQLEPSIEEKGGFSWPTPTNRDHKGGYQYGRMRNGKVSLDTLDAAVQAYRPGGLLNQDLAAIKTFGQLNPQWVEWLMGYPVGWTELSASVTALFPSKSGKRLKNY